MYTLKSKFYSIIKNRRKMVLTGLTVDSNALNTANGSLKKRESVWEDSTYNWPMVRHFRNKKNLFK